MSLELNDFFLTLAIGVLFLSGIYSLVRLFPKVNESINEFSKKNDTKKIPTVFLVLTVSLAFGILFENVSDLLCEERTRFKENDSCCFIIKTDNYYRALVLDASRMNTDILPKLWAIPSVRGQLKGEDSLIVDSIAQKKIMENVIELLKGKISNIYYCAKNEVYKNSLYNSELQKIDIRCGFCRALFLMSLMFCGLGVLIFVIFQFNFCFCKKKEKRRYGYFLFFFAFWLTLWIASVCSYRSERINYNMRVYGYYESIVNSPQY